MRFIQSFGMQLARVILGWSLLVAGCTSPLSLAGPSEDNALRVKVEVDDVTWETTGLQFRTTYASQIRVVMNQHAAFVDRFANRFGPSKTVRRESRDKVVEILNGLGSADIPKSHLALIIAGVSDARSDNSLYEVLLPTKDTALNKLLVEGLLQSKISQSWGLSWILTHPEVVDESLLRQVSLVAGTVESKQDDLLKLLQAIWAGSDEQTLAPLVERAMLSRAFAVYYWIPVAVNAHNHAAAKIFNQFVSDELKKANSLDADERNTRLSRLMWDVAELARNGWRDLAISQLKRNDIPLSTKVVAVCGLADHCGMSEMPAFGDDLLDIAIVIEAPRELTDRIEALVGFFLSDEYLLNSRYDVAGRVWYSTAAKKEHKKD